MIQAVALGALVAAAVTVLALAVVLPWLRRLGVIDIPVERSMHSTPIVRGAGLALLPGLLAGTAATEYLLSRSDHAMVTFSSTLYVLVALVVVLAFAGVGLSDDFFSHGVLGRLLLQLGIGGLAAGAILASVGTRQLWLVPVAVGLVASVNITNFMDGANGLLILHGLVTAAWFCGVAAAYGMSGPTGLAAAAGGALLALLPVNLRGRAFLGDVGSYALGAVWGVFAWLMLLAGVPAEAVVAPAVVFLADFAYTLQLRIRAGDRWYQPHKLHVYQRLISAGWPHVASSGLVATLTGICCVLSLPALLGADPAVRTVCILFAMALVAAYLRLPVLIGAPVPWHDARSRGKRGDPRKQAP